ncbi:MAG: hypothetical protein Q7S02_02860 [bacterium]|nr:hypothetical protein [bacterium]
MRAVLVGLLVILTTSVESSVLPWIPLLSHVRLVGVVTAVLIAVRPQTYEYLWFAIAATLLSDMIVGAPIGARAVLFLAAFLALQPLIRSFRVDPRVLVIVAVGVVLAFVDHLGVALATRTFPAAFQWAAMLAEWWWAAVANIVVGYLAFRIARRMTPR